MGPKKKGKKKAKVKEKRPKTPKSVYIARIAEKNALLAAARRRNREVEDAYYSTQKRYEQTQEDMTDIIKYLQHEIEENSSEIISLNEKAATYREEISKNDKYYVGILSKMKSLYNDAERSLNYKIRQHLPKLSAFEEIRQHREEFLKKKEVLNKKMQDVKARRDKEIYEAEKQIIIKQDTLQKEMEYKLKTLARDFNQATDIAIGETTNKVVRDNIVLGNRLTCTQEIFDKSRNSFLKVNAVEKKLKYHYDLVEEENFQILQKYSAQVSSIENLVKSFEELKEKIGMCGKLIKENRRLQRLIAEKECELNAEETRYQELLKKLLDSEEKFNVIKNQTKGHRKNLANLESKLAEALKVLKYALNVQELTELPEEVEEGLGEMQGDDPEENLKEFQFKVRQTVTEQIFKTLTLALQMESDPQMDRMSEVFLAPHSSLSFQQLKLQPSRKKVHT